MNSFAFCSVFLYCVVFQICQEATAQDSFNDVNVISIADTDTSNVDNNSYNNSNNVYYEMFAVKGGSFTSATELENSLKTMVEAYFPTVESVKNLEMLAYHRQSTNNLLELKRPGIFNKIECMAVDFTSDEASNPLEDPLVFVNHLEKEIREATELENGMSVDLEVNEKVIELFLDKVFDSPRSAETNPENAYAVGAYLFRKMGRLGLLVHMQDFRDKEEESHGELTDDFLTSSSGTNAIGIIPGEYWGTPQDRPIIVGAHWDTVSTSPGYNDNGSGAAALLEIASTLVRAKCHKTRHSIIFVAFDAEEVGCYGSLEFIRSFIIPAFVERGHRIQGAFVLDTLLNWDDTEGSQDVIQHWHKILPEVTSAIEANGRKGDFLALISRRCDADAILAETFRRQFDKLSGRDQFRIQPFEVTTLPTNRFPTTDEMLNHTFFWRSDHSRFWYYKDDVQFRSFGAVLLSDTASYRGYMRSCYHSECDSGSNPNLRKAEGLKFLTKTAQAVVLAVAELSGGLEECDLTKIYGQEESFNNQTVDKNSSVDKNSTVDKDSNFDENSTVDKELTANIDSTADKESIIESFVSSTKHTFSSEEDESVDEVVDFNGVDVVADVKENEIQAPTDVEDLSEQLDDPKKTGKDPVSSSGGFATDLLQLLLNNYLGKVPRSFWSSKTNDASTSLSTENDDAVDGTDDQEMVSSEFNERRDGDEDMDDDDTGEEIEMDRPKKSNRVTNNYNGPYQPNYGNQYNIDHLTLSIPTNGLSSSQGQRSRKPSSNRRQNPFTKKTRNNYPVSPSRRFTSNERDISNRFRYKSSYNKYSSNRESDDNQATVVRLSGNRRQEHRDNLNRDSGHRTFPKPSNSEPMAYPNSRYPKPDASPKLLFMPTDKIEPKNSHQFSQYQSKSQETSLTQANSNSGELGMAGFYLQGLLNLLEERKSGLKDPDHTGQKEMNLNSESEDHSSQPSVVTPVVKYSPMVITLLKD